MRIRSGVVLVVLAVAGCATAEDQHVASGPQFPLWCAQLAQEQADQPSLRDRRYSTNGQLPPECLYPAVEAIPPHPVPKPRK